jgi:hypothetical protein
MCSSIYRLWKEDKTGKAGSTEASEPETFITQR